MITLKGNVDYSPKVCGATDKMTLYEPKSSSFSEKTLILFADESKLMKFFSFGINL